VKQKEIFRGALLGTYALVAILCFCLVVRLITLYKPDTGGLEILLRSVAVTAGFIGVLHSFVRHSLLGTGKRTYLGRCVSRAFALTPDLLAEALVFPWQATILSAVVLFIVDFVVSLIGK
jgi:hypothetical protein